MLLVFFGGASASVPRVAARLPFVLPAYSCAMAVSFPPMTTQSLFDSRPPLSFKSESSLSLSVTPSSLSTPSLALIQLILRNYKVSGGRGTVDEEVNISTTLLGG